MNIKGKLLSVVGVLTLVILAVPIACLLGWVAFKYGKDFARQISEC